MKTLITTAAIALLFTSVAYAADEKVLDPKPAAKQGEMMQGGMMNSDMMKGCQEHMKDGKMMDSMPKDMMQQCQNMMKGGMMQQDGMKDMKPSADAAKPDASKAADDADHANHHPAQ